MRCHLPPNPLFTSFPLQPDGSAINLAHTGTRAQSDDSDFAECMQCQCRSVPMAAFGCVGGGLSDWTGGEHIYAEPILGELEQILGMKKGLLCSRIGIGLHKQDY